MPGPANTPEEITPERLMHESSHLYGYAVLRVGDHHHSEELVQDCILAAWRQREEFDYRSSLRTWLVGILKHKILDHHRRQTRTPSRPNDLAETQDEETGHPLDGWFNSHGSWKIHPTAGLEFLNDNPSKTLRRNEVLDMISKCLTALPVKLRTLFTVRELDDLGVPEAAKAAGVAANSAAVMLTRARQKLRDCLQQSFL